MCSMSKQYICTVKLITLLLVSNLLPILCRALLPMKTSFFKVTNGIIYICPLTVKIHLRTVSTSFIVCDEPFCEVLHNSINYFLCYKETCG